MSDLASERRILKVLTVKSRSEIDIQRTQAKWNGKTIDSLSSQK
jgi:hypothetical protein